MSEKITSFLNSFSLQSHNLGTGVFLPIIVVIVTAEVVFRYFLRSPLVWSQELTSLLLFLLFFLSLAYCWDRKKHIHMDVVYGRLKGRWRGVADIFSGAAGILLFGMMGIQSLRDIPYMIATHETGEELGFPYWPFRAVMACYAFLFVLKLTRHLLLGFSNLLHKGEGR